MGVETTMNITQPQQRFAVGSDGRGPSNIGDTSINKAQVAAAATMFGLIDRHNDEDYCYNTNVDRYQKYQSDVKYGCGGGRICGGDDCHNNGDRYYPLSGQKHYHDHSLSSSLEKADRRNNNDKATGTFSSASGGTETHGGSSTAAPPAASAGNVATTRAPKKGVGTGGTSHPQVRFPVRFHNFVSSVDDPDVCRWVGEEGVYINEDHPQLRRYLQQHFNSKFCSCS